MLDFANLWLLKNINKFFQTENFSHLKFADWNEKVKKGAKKWWNFSQSCVRYCSVHNLDIGSTVVGLSDGKKKNLHTKYF